MKRIIIMLIMICVCTRIVYGQVEVGVWTEKSTYNYGDTIAITVTAYNPTADTLILQFGSTCQANYIIDDFNFYYHIGCAMVLTARRIPPFSTVSWDYLKYPMYASGWPSLSVGTHFVVGEVIGYTRSDTLVISVTSVNSVSLDNSMVTSFKLGQNYPNPFNGTTSIPFTVSNPGRVVIGLYNSLGQKIRPLFNNYCQLGSYLVKVELNNEPSGVYWCRLQYGGKVQTTKLILSK